MIIGDTGNEYLIIIQRRNRGENEMREHKERKETK
jgi:hypothetical protein